MNKIAVAIATVTIVIVGIGIFGVHQFVTSDHDQDTSSNVESDANDQDVVSIENALEISADKNIDVESSEDTADDNTSEELVQDIEVWCNGEKINYEPTGGCAYAKEPGDTDEFVDGSTCEPGVVYSAELKKCVEITPPTPAVTTKTYTNAFLPDFAINYPSDWTFNTSTEEAVFYSGNTLIRTTILTKGSTTLRIITRPDVGIPCGQEGQPDSVLLKANINGSVYSRFDNRDGVGDFYYDSTSINSSCPALMSTPSTVLYSDIVEGYNGTPNEKVVYSVSVDVRGAEFLDEADTIVSSSNLSS